LRRLRVESDEEEPGTPEKRTIYERNILCKALERYFEEYAHVNLLKLTALKNL
jgi:hypothetical protein